MFDQEEVTYSNNMEHKNYRMSRLYLSTNYVSVQKKVFFSSFVDGVVLNRITLKNKSN